MKSIKPGRGPSRQSAVASAASVIFGIFWTIAAASMTWGMGGFGVIGIIFPLFGLVFVGLGIYNTIYHARNATGENRHSIVDIVDGEEEPDPLDPDPDRWRRPGPAADAAYCPWCGEKLAEDYRFCPKCGRELPNK